MGTALSIAVFVVMYAGSFAVLGAYVAGSIGLVRATSRTARQHGLPRVSRVVMAIVASVVALVGGGLVFAFFWPFRQLWTTRTSEPRRRRLYVAAVLGVLLASATMTTMAVAGPCFFDPPPGDQLTLTIANDTSTAVTVVDCLDDGCAEAQSSTPVAAGRRASMPLEGCTGGTMGVLDARTGLLQDCIAEPTDHGDGNLRIVAVSEGRPCAHAGTGARVRIDDAGG